MALLKKNTSDKRLEDETQITVRYLRETNHP